MDLATRDLSDDGIAAIADPVERAVVLRAISRDRGTLTPTQSAMYRAAVAELRDGDGRVLKWIARKVGISRGRVSQILSRHARTEAAA